jgi:hypothetical protein
LGGARFDERGVGLEKGEGGGGGEKKEEGGRRGVI